MSQPVPRLNSIVFVPCGLQDITVAGVEKSITDMVGRETESVDVSEHKFCREFDDTVNKVSLSDSQQVDEADTS